MQQREGSGFSAVDRTSDPQFFIHFLDAVNAWPFYQRQKERSLALLDPQPGQHLLDVGSGLGDVTCALARRVGPQGRAVGVDPSATMRAEAQRRSDALGLAVEYRDGRAEQLPFPDAAFDGCRADRVLMYLSDPARAVAEMTRVLRPGGTMVVGEVDKETVVVAHPDRVLTRHLLNFWCDSYASGWVGRELANLFRDAGLQEVALEPMTLLLTEWATVRDVFQFPRVAELAVAAGRVSSADAQRWLNDLAEADRRGRFLFANTVFLVTGRKPGGAVPAS